jgi:hypothetical protein
MIRHRNGLEYLEKAASGGIRNLEFLHSSDQLDSIREREDFKALLRRLESSSAWPK